MGKRIKGSELSSIGNPKEPFSFSSSIALAFIALSNPVFPISTTILKFKVSLTIGSALNGKYLSIGEDDPLRVRPQCSTTSILNPLSIGLEPESGLSISCCGISSCGTCSKRVGSGSGTRSGLRKCLSGCADIGSCSANSRSRFCSCFCSLSKSSSKGSSCFANV